MGLTAAELEGFMAVYSSEKATVDLLPLNDEQFTNPGDFGAVDYLRLRVIPVLGTSPSIFGQAMASYVLCNLANRAYAPETCERMSKNLRQKVLKMLRKDEVARFSSDAVVDLDEDDCELVVQQVWGGRCAFSGKRFGGHNPLALSRWDPTRPPQLDNLVLLAASEGSKLAQGGPAAFTAEQRAAVDERLAWVKATFSDELTVPTPLRLLDLHSAQSSFIRRLLRAGLTATPLVDTACVALTAAASALVLQRLLLSVSSSSFR